MTAPVVPTVSVPRPRRGADEQPHAGRVTTTSSPAPAGRAAAYQRVLHQLVRRELRTLADLAAWAPDGESSRTATLTRHAGLLVRVLLHHHAVEREALWPALLHRVPVADRAAAQDAVAAWTAACSRIDARLRDLETGARQWAVAGAAKARHAFVRACSALADDVAAQTAEEERTLLPLLDRHLPDDAWAAISRGARCGLSARERLMVLGLALEDSSPGERARLLSGLPRTTRLAWRLYGRSRYRAGTVRLRGAPPAAWDRTRQ